MKTRSIIAMAAALAMSLLGYAESIKAGASAKVTLNADGEAVLTVTGLNKGSAYTFVSETPANEDEETTSMELLFQYRDPDWEYESGEYDEDTLGYSDADIRNTTTERMIIQQEDWESASLVKGPDWDPDIDTLVTPKGYFLHLFGPAGATVTITSMSGIVGESVPAGCRDNAVSLGVIPEGKSKALQRKAAFIPEDDEYWFQMSLVAGRQYVFTISGSGINGTATMFFNGQDESADGFPLPEVEDEGATIVYTGVPTATGTFYLQIEGEGQSAFNLSAYGNPTRPVDKHPLAGTLADDVTLDAVVGARNDSDGLFYDEVIDTSLFAVELKAGRLACFEATAETSENCVLELYDGKGTLLGQNYYKDATGKGQFFALVPEQSGTYYVGYCQSELDLASLPTNMTPEAASVTGKVLYKDAGEVSAEADDKPLTGNTISIALGTAETEGALQLKADGTSHAFDATNHVDWYILGARKGIVYNFAAVADAEHYVVERPINLSVYTVTADGKVTLVENLGDAQEGVAFVAPKSMTYYVKASLENGQGCACPYDFYAWVSGENYGFLKVDVKGATTGQWNLKGETANKYSAGSEIILEAGEYVVQSTAVSGWTKPADQTATVVAGNENRTTVTLKYCDTSDPKDDVATGAVALAPTKAKPVTASRSLWTDDKADIFKLTVKQGTVYGLALEISEGSPEINVYRSTAFTGPIVSGTDVQFMAQEKGTYYVVVTRAEDAADVDAAYALTATSCDVGTVKTDKTEYKVGEKAGYLTVKFSRTSKEGKVRVRYTTVEDTAKANVNYEAKTGILTWEDGDSKAQEVKIKIIPDLIDTWDEDRQFSIRIDAIADDEFDAMEEYRPLLAMAEVPVTITDSSKVAPGTIQIAAYGDEQETFANPAKPVLSVAAGGDAVLWLSRTAGSDKMVAVKATVTAKQVAGSEFVVADEQEIWWDDGDTEAKELRIQTGRPSDAYFAPQTFTVKLAVLAADAKATVKNGSATVTVYDGDTVRTFDDYAASFPKASGVTVKAGAKDTWYFDAAGALCSAYPAKAGGKSELTFSVTGPGRLRFAPEFVAAADVTCTALVGKNALQALDGSPADFFLGAGKTDVKFTVTRGKAAANDAEAMLVLAPQDGGVPFLWEPLTTPALVKPLLAAELQNPAHFELAWTGSDCGNVRYRLWCDKNKANVGTDKAEFCFADGHKMLALPSWGLCASCGDPALDVNASYSWRVDSVMLDDEGEVRLVNTNKTVWTFKTAVAGAPVPTVAATADISGTEFSVADLISRGEPVNAVQGVNVTNLVFGSETADVTWALVSGAKLPAGMALNKATGALTGAPQKPGDYYVAVQPTAGKVPGSALAFTLHVDPIELAAGTFNGLLETSDSEVVDVAGRENLALGALMVTVAEGGKITAKAVVGTTSYAFSGTCYDALATMENGQPGAKAVLKSVAKLNNVPYTNTLTLAACRAGTNDWAAVDTPMTAEMDLTFLAADKKTVVSNVVWSGMALRDNTKFKQVVEAQAPYVGYYTVSLPATAASVGLPQGNGYLTLTLDAKGKAKIAGMLADGTSFSGSAVIGFISDEGSGESLVWLPVFYAKNLTTCGGWLKIKLSDHATVDDQDISAGRPLPVLDASSVLTWVNGDLHASFDGEAWSSYALELQPVGGYYSTIVNLQTYYKDYAVYLVDLMDGDQLPEALKGETREWAAYPGMIVDEASGLEHGLYVDLSVNNLLVDKQVLSYKLDDAGRKTKLIDWASSVNPCKFTMAFKAATGLFDASFDVYAATLGEKGEELTQVKTGSFKGKGVLLMTRDQAAPLEVEDAVLSGFYTAPARLVDPADKKSYTWNASYKLLFGGAKIVNPPEEGWDD